MTTLDVKPYDPETDTIKIEGIRYSGALFRELGFKTMLGRIFRVVAHDGKVITLKQIDPATELPVLE